MEARRCVRQSRAADEAVPEPSDGDANPGPRLTRTHPQGGQNMATKDKNTKKSMEKKPAQKTLKEKRQAKKAKK
jgi:hypothetical protein